MPQNNFIPFRLSPEQKLIACILALVLITFSAYFQVINNKITNWDDGRYIYENTLIKDFSVPGIAKIFTSFHAGMYKPLVMLSFALEYRIFGPDPAVFHGTNLLFHVLNALLVFGFVFFLTDKISAAFIISSLFALHPMHVESVAWISERKDMLFAFFFLISMLYYVRYVKDSKPVFYVYSCLSFAATFLVKPMGIVLPLLIILTDLRFARGLTKKTILEKIPFFAVLILFGVITFIAQAKALSHEKTALVLSLSSFKTAGYVVMFYIGKLFMPLGLSCAYPDPEHISFLIPAAAVCVVAAAAVLFMNKKTADTGYGVLFYLIMIIPVLQFFPTGPCAVADRYTYISYIGLFYALAMPALYAADRYKCGPMLSGIFIFILAILSSMTVQRTAVWRDSVTLWSDALLKNPGDKIAHFNRASAYIEAGRWSEAVGDLNVLIGEEPDRSELYRNRAVAHIKLGQYEKGMTDLNTAIELDPHDAAAFYNRGLAFLERGDSISAFKDISTAIRLDPMYTDAYEARGIEYVKAGEYGIAIPDLDKAVQNAPDRPRLFIFRGIAYNMTGRFEEAVSDYSKANEMDPSYGSRFLEEAMILYKQGDKKGALWYANLARAFGNRVGDIFVTSIKKEMNSSK